MKSVFLPTVNYIVCILSLLFRCFFNFIIWQISSSYCFFYVAYVCIFLFVSFDFLYCIFIPFCVLFHSSERCVKRSVILCLSLYLSSMSVFAFVCRALVYLLGFKPDAYKFLKRSLRLGFFYSFLLFNSDKIVVFLLWNHCGHAVLLVVTKSASAFLFFTLKNWWIRS